RRRGEEGQSWITVAYRRLCRAAASRQVTVAGRSGSGRRSRALALERVEAVDDLLRVPDERAGVEDRVEVELGRGGRQELAERRAGVPRLLCRLLDDAVGLVARAVALDQREQGPLRVERAVSGLQVRAHPVGVDGHAAHDAYGQVLRVVEQDRGVGQGDALDRGMRDVAL